MSVHNHIVPLKVYIRVIGALLVLTVLTVAVAQVDFGFLNVVMAMGIATVKAGLVLLFFMHLKYDNLLFPVIFLISVFFLLVLFLFCELDVLTRVPETSVL